MGCIGLGLLAIASALVWRAISRTPVNYTSLALSSVGEIRYQPLVGPTQTFKLSDVIRLEHLREEALFPDPFTGTYLEASWLIHLPADKLTHDGASAPPDPMHPITVVEIMDESANRQQLIRAFSQHLTGFDPHAALKATRGKVGGRVHCFGEQRLHPQQPTR